MFRKKFLYVFVVFTLVFGIVPFNNVADAADGTYDWSIRLGGSLVFGGGGSPDYGDTASAVAYAPNGDIVIVGRVKENADLDGDGDATGATNDNREVPSGSLGATDIYISVFDSGRNFRWSRRLGGSTSSDYPTDVAVDANGHIVVVGDIFGDADLDGDTDATGATGESAVGYGGLDSFVSVFDADGLFQWSKRLGSTGDDYFHSVAIGANQDIIIGGQIGSYGHLVAYSSDGLTTRFTKTIQSHIYSVATDASGNVAAAGGVNSGAIDLDGDGNTTGTGETSGPGANDATVSVFDSTGAIKWVKRLGGTSTDDAYGVTFDSSGNLTMTGLVTRDGDLNMDNDTSDDGEAEIVFSGSYDIFLSSFDTAGTYRWSKRIFSSYWDGDHVNDIATDASDNVVVVGEMYGIADLNGDGTRDDVNINGESLTAVSDHYDPYVSVFDSSGTYQWSIRLGNSSRDYTYGVAINSSTGAFMLAGSVTGAADLDGDGDTSGATGESATNYGAYDAFVTSFTMAYNSAPTLSLTSATPATDGTGEVSIVSTVDDADDNELSITYYYSPDTCSESLPSTTSTISAVSSANGVAVTSTGSYQVTTVTTTPGANIVTSTWDTQSQSALASANGTYCVYAYAYDGTVTSTVATTTVTLDNVAPLAPSIDSFTMTSTTMQADWSAVTDTHSVNYTVNSNADVTVSTTSATSLEYTGLTPNTNFTWQIKATDSYGNASVYSTATSSYTNPALPITVTATANGQTSAIVSWSANGNPTGTTYEVGNNKSSVYNKTTTSTKTTITGLTPNTEYYFKVKAISASGNTSQDTAYTDYTSAITTAAQTQTVSMVLVAGEAASSFQFAGSQDSHTAEITSVADYDGVAKAIITLHSTTVTTGPVGAGEAVNLDLNGNGSDETTLTVNSVNVSTGEVNFTLTSIPQGISTIYSNPPTVNTKNNVKALIINSGEATTKTRGVTLNFNVENAELMAIANNAEFEDVSFEKYNSTKDWTLSEGNGLKTVYAKFRSAQGGTIIYSGQITLTGQSTDAKDEVVEIINDNSNCPLTKEQAYKTTINKSVYYITTNCTKRAFQRSDIYFSYFTSWKDVNLTDSKTLNLIPNDNLGFMPWGPKYDPKYGALVKTVTDPKVYLLLNNNKYWITNETTFNQLNYNWNWIEDIDQRLLEKYTTKEEITDTTTHPNYTLIKYENDPKVYRLEPDTTNPEQQVKRHIPNETEFNKLNFRFDRVVTVPDSEVYSEGENLES